MAGKTISKLTLLLCLLFAGNHSIAGEYPSRNDFLTVKNFPTDKLTKGEVVSIYSKDKFSFRSESGEYFKVRIEDVPKELTKDDLKEKIFHKDVEIGIYGEDSSKNKLAVVFVNADPVFTSMRKEEIKTQLPAVSRLMTELKSSPQPEEVKKAALTHWLNTKTSKRHNRTCRYYGSTKDGRACGATDGVACKICGG